MKKRLLSTWQTLVVVVIIVFFVNPLAAMPISLFYTPPATGQDGPEQSTTPPVDPNQVRASLNGNILKVWENIGHNLSIVVGIYTRSEFLVNTTFTDSISIPLSDEGSYYIIIYDEKGFDVKGRFEYSLTSILQAAIWHCVEMQVEPFLDMPTTFTPVTFRLEGDTVFNNVSYKILRQDNGGYRGAVRQTANGNQVYFRPAGGNGYPAESGNEYLLYDFDVQVGDTVYAYYGFWDTTCEDWLNYFDNTEGNITVTPAWKVTAIQTLDGRRHVQVRGIETPISLSTNIGWTVEWIEGIGTQNIIFPTTMHCWTGYTSTWTLCVEDNEGNLPYTHDTSHLSSMGNPYTCQTITDIEELPATDFQPGNNTAPLKTMDNGQVLIITPDGKSYDLTGKEVQ